MITIKNDFRYILSFIPSIVIAKEVYNLIDFRLEGDNRYRELIKDIFNMMVYISESVLLKKRTSNFIFNYLTKIDDLDINIEFINIAEGISCLISTVDGYEEIVPLSFYLLKTIRLNNKEKINHE